MSVQPNADGYLVRSGTANLPTNAAGYTIMKWFQRIGAVATGFNETLFELNDVGDGDYIKIYVNDAHEVHFQGINDFDDTNLFTATLNTWYFLALVTTSTTQGTVYWRADASGSLSSSAGRPFQTDNGWDSLTLLNNAGGLETAEHFRMSAYKEWHSALSSAQILAESNSRAPVVAGASCYLPFTSASGSDQSGNGRNFTVTGTLAANAAEPTSISATVVTMGGPLTVAAAIQSPAAASLQPVTMGGALALAAAIQAPAITYPVALGGPVPVAAAIQSPAALSVQPVTLGAPVAVSATVQAPAVGQLAQPTAVAATLTPQQPALGSTQPVTLAAALQLALTVQAPAVASSGIAVSSPAPIVLAVPQPAIDDPYPHAFPRRSRGDFRRAKLG